MHLSCEINTTQYNTLLERLQMPEAEVRMGWGVQEELRYITGTIYTSKISRLSRGRVQDSAFTLGHPRTEMSRPRLSSGARAEHGLHSTARHLLSGTQSCGLGV